MAPGIDVKPPRIRTGSAFERQQGQRELHAELVAEDDAGHQRDHAGDRPHQQPDRVQRDADRLRGLMVVGDGAQGPADARILEEERQREHQERADDGRDHVGPVDQQPARKDTLENEDGCFGRPRSIL